MDSGTDEPPRPTAAKTPFGDAPLPTVEGELRRPKISLLYRIGLLAVSLAMILLPLFYFAVIGTALYGLGYYASNVADVMGPGHSGSTRLLAAMPLIAGLVFIFFLVKPLFAPKAEPARAFSIEHADAPQLFALIGWICRSLKAPIPSRVDVDLSINAGVDFRVGARSLFRNDLVLIIGLPLVAGLDLRQFTGVIAHEYGHFSQGAAMRAGYLIRRVNAWLFRVVYERDRWDQALFAASKREGEPFLTLLVVLLVRFGIWTGRAILWVLMWIGQLLSSFLSRQMEFDADLYEIRMCGGQSFVATQRRLHQLELGAALAQKQMVEHWKKEKKLFDQIPALIVQKASEIPAEIQSRHHSVRDQRRTRLFDSHPSDAERIRRAVAANEPGIFHAATLATQLFTDFPALARRVTLAHYREMVGPGFREEALVSTAQSVRRADYDPGSDEQILERYFLGVPTALRPIFVAENKTKAVRPLEPLIASVLSNRETMGRRLAEAQAAYAAIHEADARALQACQAAHLLRAGFQFDPADFRLVAHDTELAQTEAERALRLANAALFHFEEAGRTRLADTVQVLHLCQSTTVIPDVRRLGEEARQLVWVLSRLAPVFEPLLELRKDCAALDMLLRYRRRQPAADNITPALEDLCAGIQERINSIQELTAQIRYPFEHPAGQIMVGHYLRNTEYQANAFELTLREGNSHVGKSVVLHQRLLARLVLICEQVEQGVLSGHTND